MAAPNLVAPLNAIVALLEGTAGIQDAAVGSPLVLTTRVSAFVDFLGQQVTDRASSGLKQTEAGYYVGIGYRVQGAEATAALGMAAVVPAFIDAFYSTGQRTLSGTCHEARLVADIPTTPIYVTFAGQEYRVIPLNIRAIIRHQ